MSASEPQNDRYDAVVVGAGLAGLSAAASLARAGKKVLAVERGEGAGGYAHAFERGPYTFDPAIRVTAKGFGDLAFWELYLGALGIADEVEMLSVTPLYAADLPELRFHAPVGVEAFIEELSRHFPKESDSIRRFIDACVQITEETQQVATRVGLSDLDAALEKFPLLFKYRTATVADALDEHIGDHRAKSVLGAAWPYQGLPPSKLSIVQYGGMLAALMEKGPGYPRGSFQRLADGFASAIQNSGGELVLNTHVTKILVEDGRVAGAVLEGGRTVRADTVISNADAKQTLEELIGLEHFPDAFVKRYRRMRPSISAFVLYAATTTDVTQLDLAHEIFVYKDWDHEETYRGVLEGKLGGTWLSLPSIHDRSLSPEGEHIVIYTTLMPYDIGEPWDAAKDRYTELMTQDVERVIPGFRETMTYSETATPETLHRYTLNQGGALYGWENTPNQTLPKRLTHRPPLEGLFLAGHWTEPGSSSFRVVYSGLQAAQSALGLESPVELLQLLDSAG